jgi:threonine dehydratase
VSLSVNLLEVLRAKRRIAPYVRRTPLVRSSWLSDLAGADVTLKLESVQHSNSFKSRGAFNAVIARLERGTPALERLVTASAGNHGRALAAAAETVGLPLTVFTPADAPQVKLTAIARHGAELRADSRDYDEAERRAKAFACETGAAFISPYNDADVIAGAATVALEIFEDAADTDTLVVPIGGGGLISGAAAVAKTVRATCTVVGVEVEASCAFQTSVRAGRLVEIVPGPTLADGLGGNPDPDTITFEPIQRLVDQLVTVSEPDLEASLVGLVAAEHVVAEGAGAAATAAIVGKRVDVSGRRVAVIVSGANIDRARLAALLA